MFSMLCLNPIYQRATPLGWGICSNLHTFMSITATSSTWQCSVILPSPISCWFIWSHCLPRTAALLLLPQKSSRSMWVEDRRAILKRCGITNGSIPFQQVGMKFIPVTGVTKSNLLAKVKAIKASLVSLLIIQELQSHLLVLFIPLGTTLRIWEQDKRVLNLLGCSFKLNWWFLPLWCRI